jgi:AcrR family transcriptional regulator
MVRVAVRSGRGASGEVQADVEARIKAAAIRVVAEDGLPALSVSSLCARAGVSQASFHERWPDAWAAMLDAFDERARLPELPDKGNLQDDLVAYVLAYYDQCRDPTFAAFMFQLLVATRSDDSVREKLGPGFYQRRARNRALIGRAVARAELPYDVDGNEILDAILGLALSWMGTGKAPSRRETARAVGRLIAQAQDAP